MKLDTSLRKHVESNEKCLNFNFKGIPKFFILWKFESLRIWFSTITLENLDNSWVFKALISLDILYKILKIGYNMKECRYENLNT